MEENLKMEKANSPVGFILTLVPFEERWIMEMTVLFYINVLSGGGAERVVANLANHFSEDEIKCTIVTSNYTENEYPLSDKVKRIVLNKSSKVEKNRITKNITYIRKLRKIIKTEDIDVVISFMQEPNFRAILASIGLKNKVVVSVRNDPKKEYPGILGWLLGHFVLPLADGCVFQTQEARQWFPRNMQKKSKIIQNEVAPIFFDTSAKCTKNIVTIGRLNTQKNQMLLIKAFNKIAGEFPDENILIYGKGELKGSLEKEIKKQGLENQIYLKGTTLNVEKILSEAKIFVLSSDYEGMPNALLEALAVGVPCIATDCPCGGPREIIESEKNGILIPVGDDNELAKALRYLLKNPEISKKMSEAAKKNAEKFRPNKVYQEWKEYIYKVLAYRKSEV